MAFSLTWNACLAIFLLAQGVSTHDNLTKQREPLHPTADFSRHTLVKPKIYHGREKRQISDTKGETGEHLEHIQVNLEVDGEDVILDLTLNKQLIAKGFFHKRQENGKHVIHRPNKKEVNHCHYSGKVRGKPDSWAAISTCDGLSGVLYDGVELHYVEKDNAVDSTVSHFLYKHSDLAEHNKTCGYAGGAAGHTHSPTDNRFLRYKRSTDDDRLIRGPYNANKDSKYVELVLVVDNREYKELGESERRVIDHCKNIANIINGLYAPLNIFIALVGVVIWTEHDEIVFATSGDATLTSFLQYRKDKLVKEHPNDNAQLLTKFAFEGGVVGKALKGPMCTFAYSGGVNNDHSPVVGLVATTIAHEMGHNFGMEHDTVDCKCPPDDRCIMAPSSSTVAPTRWSTCSLNYLLLAFTHGMDYCLKNKPESLFDSPVCGNGFVEPGEQCDCGLPEHCENPCCNPVSCTLHANATCATGACCDLATCAPKNAGTLCRSADYECDLPEYCTGQSEYCPQDIYKLDTEECDDGKSFCYHGFCRTRTDQCKLLWGETGKSSDKQCYDMNVKGNKYGNCGYNKLNSSFTKCAEVDILCGMLHCKHLNERLEFGMETVSILAHSFINKKGSIIPCRTALVDLGVNEVDPGMTPDGAQCGPGKMCVNQRCMNVSSLRKQSPACEKDCNGNGWCNSNGHCHCKDGFAPPYCDYPGPGGSVDSGPAADPNARRGVVIALFVIFLGIIPGIALAIFVLYYAKYNLKLNWKSAPSTTPKSPGKSRGPSGFPSHQAAKRNEANHSLLHEDSPPARTFDTGFFGSHKGFSLTPMKHQEAEPSRAAPPPPAAASTAITWNNHSNETPAQNYQKPPPPVPTASLSNFLSKPVQKMNSFKNNSILNALKSNVATSAAPALPPLNPGSTARPIISSPVLESSTSNAKELVSPLKGAPKVPFRPAPGAPKSDSDRPMSNPELPAIQTTLEVITEPAPPKPKEKENIGTSTINRIASFLKQGDKKPAANSTNTLPKPNQVKAQKVLDKETLRTLKISDPVPQTHIDIAVTALPVDAAAKKAVVMRAQSMRTAKPKERPTIQTFGSMRQPAGYKRPLSIPSGVRPKSPPPPAPTAPAARQTEAKPSYYDDCLNEAAPLARLSEEISPTSGDNIYAVIEEGPSPEKAAKTADGLGLLGEIVSEIQNRNFDSIYSTSTLGRKKKEEEDRQKAAAGAAASPVISSEYENASSLYKSENEYSNMGGTLKSSAASTTSSGYILPSAVNVPVKEAQKKPPQPAAAAQKPALSSFRRDASTKPFGNVSSDAAPTKATPPKSVSRQVTPPNLRIRKPSPTRPLSQASFKSNRSVTNSPDLVASCNTNTANKGPDVLNGGTSSLAKKPSVGGAKPAISCQKPSLKAAGAARAVSFKKAASEVKPSKVAKANSEATPAVAKTASVGLKNAARSNSNVASLQQRFEEKKTAPKVKS